MRRWELELGVLYPEPVSRLARVRQLVRIDVEELESARRDPLVRKLLEEALAERARVIREGRRHH